MIPRRLNFIMYICVVMNFSTSYCLLDTRMDQWNVYMYVCMYLFTELAGAAGKPTGSGSFKANQVLRTKMLHT